MLEDKKKDAGQENTSSRELFTGMDTSSPLCEGMMDIKTNDDIHEKEPEDKNNHE